VRIADALLLEFRVLRAHVHLRLEPLRRRSERGASAVEWAIITGISVAAAVTIGELVWDKINQGAASIGQDLPTGGGGGGGGAP
jgi:Flp pilus assembly pilin Flp